MPPCNRSEYLVTHKQVPPAFEPMLQKLVPSNVITLMPPIGTRPRRGCSLPGAAWWCGSLSLRRFVLAGEHSRF